MLAISDSVKVKEEADKFIYLGNYSSGIRHNPIKELSLAGALNGQAVLGGKLALGTEYRESSRPRHGRTDYFYLQGEMSGDSENIRFPRLRGHIIHDNTNVGSYYDTLDDMVVTSIGYDYLDFRVDDLNNDADGFVAHHLHILGFEHPAFKTSIGLGHAGVGKIGGFKQHDLNAWAGEDADLTYILFHEGALGFKWMPLRKNGPLVGGVDMKPMTIRGDDGIVVIAPNGDPGQLYFDVYLSQARTVGGDIDFPDGVDGDFTAIWGELSITATQRVWGNSYLEGQEKC